MADSWDNYIITLTGDTLTGTYSLGSLFTTSDSVFDTGDPSSPTLQPGADVSDDGGSGGNNDADTNQPYQGSITIDGVTGYIAGPVGGFYSFYVPHAQDTGTAGGTGLLSGHTFSASSVTTGAPFDFGAPCFTAGTMIATPHGERAVETLSAGDLVLTADGTAKPVLWLGRSTRSLLFADRSRVLPIRIKAGALGMNLPARDLVVSPGHAMLIDGALVNAGALVNGTSVVRETATPTVFTYYHVELESHDLLLAEGAATESFLDGVEDVGFDNLAERSADRVIQAQLPYPRVKSARQLSASIRDLLAARASAIAPDTQIAA